MRYALAPRLVDASLLGAVVLVLASGLLTAFAGRSGDAWVFVLHGIAGVLVIPFLVWKLLRVRSRLRPSRWGRTTIVSLLALIGTLGALSTGFFWTFGGDFTVARWNAMNVHVFFGILLVPFLIAHLVDRFRVPTQADLEGRRTAVQYAFLAGSSILAWRLQRMIVDVFELFPSRRFTGSRERGEEPGNTFPVTMWVIDDPDSIDESEWSISVEGAVVNRQQFDYEELLAVEDELQATLDCTSGWYTTQDWRGIRVGRLLDAASPRSAARWVSFISVTGYRWSLPLEEAREALVATHVGGERLSHGHGSPARLVAPGRRGFQWVKWVETIEVRTSPDYRQWIAIFTSGFTSG